MPELPSPTATRLARPRWLDLRLVLGLVLVLASVLLGARVMSASDDSVAVWALRHDVAPRTALSSGDLEVREVRVPGGAMHYVHAAQPAAGLVTTRRVTSGELLPASAVVRGSLRDFREVALAVDAVVARGLQENAVVDIYVIPRVDARADDAGVGQTSVTPVLRSATVVDRGDDGRGLGASATVAVTVLVPSDRVGRVVAATARGDVQLVRVPVTAGADE